MNLRLSAKYSPADAVKRLARRELGKAAESLTRPRRRTESVHVARKHVKKVRALLRLVRKRIGSNAFRSENTTLRELGRQLSAVRDAQVVLATLENLRQTTRRGPAARALTGFHGLLNRSSPANAPRNVSALEARDRAHEFNRCRRRAKHWPLKKLTWADLAAALTDSYRRSRRALARYDAQRTLPNLHEWRKRTKDFWYQLLMLECLLPPVIRRLTPRIEALTEAQGAAHDLDLLRTAMDAQRRELPTADHILLEQLIQKRLQHLEGEILKEGRKIFTDTAKHLASQLNS